MSNISFDKLAKDTLILSYKRIDNDEIVENKYFKEYDPEKNNIKVGYKLDDNRGYIVNLDKITDIKLDNQKIGGKKMKVEDITDIDTEYEDVKKKNKKNKKIKKKTKEVNINKKQYTDQEQNTILKNAYIVKPEDWPKIIVGTRISYYKEDGTFTANVYFDHHYFKNFEDKQVSYLKLSNNRGLDKSYSIRTSIISEIYKYIDAQEMRMANMIDIVTNMKLKILEHEAKLKELDEKHTNKYKKLLQLIKQLHPNSFEK